MRFVILILTECKLLLLLRTGKALFDVRQKHKHHHTANHDRSAESFEEIETLRVLQRKKFQNDGQSDLDSRQSIMKQKEIKPEIGRRMQMTWRKHKQLEDPGLTTVSI
jgi:hypothetical protein